jgi:hypothetical protein
MSTITYDAASAPAAKAASAPVRKRSGWFAALMESRQKQAMLELRRHGLRLPRELEEAGMKISARNEDALPFVR